jgi:hypothetical protein
MLQDGPPLRRGIKHKKERVTNKNIYSSKSVYCKKNKRIRRVETIGFRTADHITATKSFGTFWEPRNHTISGVSVAAP